MPDSSWSWGWDWSWGWVKLSWTLPSVNFQGWAGGGRWGRGWVDGSIKNKAISASNSVEVEVEVEHGKISLTNMDINSGWSSESLALVVHHLSF